MKQFLLLFAALGLFAHSSFAALPIVGILNAGIDFGGDDLVTITYTNGASSTVTAGKGVLLNVGAVCSPYEFDNSALDVQATLGYKFGTTAQATNQSVSFTRIPLEILAFYRHKPTHLRFGAGAGFHLSPTLTATGSLVTGEVSFNNSIGMILGADYVLAQSSTFLLGLRYNVMTYQRATGTTTLSTNANAIGFIFGWAFGGPY